MLTGRKIRNLLLILFIALFMTSFSPVFFWLALAVVVLFGSSSHKPIHQYDKNLEVIKRKARAMNVRWPVSHIHRKKLAKIYSLYESSKRNRPQLSMEYDGIIEEMWESLSQSSEVDHWNEILDSVMLGWPDSPKGDSGSLKDRLRRVKSLSEQWDDAKGEALGGSHV